MVSTIGAVHGTFLIVHVNARRATVIKPIHRIAGSGSALIKV